VTELYEKGEPIPPAKISEFVEWFRQQVERFTVITFSGTLPPGVPSDFYAQLIQIANTARIPTLLDSSGDALRHGITAKPTLVKPNRVEFEGLIGQPLQTMQDCEHFAIETSRRFETTVVITLGAKGVICAQDDRVFHIQPPRLKIVSAIGSGDSLMAGIALGLARSQSLEDSLKWGVAAGSANAMTMGAGVFAAGDFQRVLGGITVSRSSDEL